MDAITNQKIINADNDKPKISYPWPMHKKYYLFSWDQGRRKTSSLLCIRRMNRNSSPAHQAVRDK